MGDGSNAYEISSSMTLTYPNTYNLKGFVYVTEGATLTIEPGVVIKGEKESKATLIVERGGKLIAEGTSERPIVFTSAQAPGKRKPGDWGGIILLGKAKNNMGEQTIEGGVRSKHGGNDDTDNSGVLNMCVANLPVSNIRLIMKSMPLRLVRWVAERQSIMYKFLTRETILTNGSAVR